MKCSFGVNKNSSEPQYREIGSAAFQISDTCPIVSTSVCMLMGRVHHMTDHTKTDSRQWVCTMIYLTPVPLHRSTAAEQKRIQCTYLNALVIIASFTYFWWHAYLWNKSDNLGKKYAERVLLPASVSHAGFSAVCLSVFFNTTTRGH